MRIARIIPRLLERLLQRWKRDVFRRLVMIYGAEEAPAQVHIVLSQFRKQFLIYCTLSLLVWGFAQFDFALGICFLLILCTVVYLPIYRLDRLIKQRERDIRMDLPLLVNKMILLLGAGETVSNVLKRCTETGRSGRVLNQELARVVHAMQNGVSIAGAMVEFSRRCTVKEATMLANTILLNVRRGNTDLALSLHTISTQLWEERKNTARMIGEEASSKMIFPLMLIFIIVIGVIAAPAILFIQGG